MLRVNKRLIPSGFFYLLLISCPRCFPPHSSDQTPTHFGLSPKWLKVGPSARGEMMQYLYMGPSETLYRVWIPSDFGTLSVLLCVVWYGWQDWSQWPQGNATCGSHYDSMFCFISVSLFFSFGLRAMMMNYHSQYPDEFSYHVEKTDCGIVIGMF